ncbi:MAG TPA: NAD-dependent epimerase/dehydratase family protein, partial [Pirellulales bacterium]
MAQRYLVTGAVGFIGSRVSRLLLDAGHAVLGIDNLNAAYDPRLKQSRLAALTCLPGFAFKRLDITDGPTLERLFTEVASQRNLDCNENDPPFTAVFNLAARAGVQPSVDDPHTYFRTNAEGTLNLLELCRQYRVRKFVLASTSSLYGA